MKNSRTYHLGGLKSIGAGLGIAGNALRPGNVNQLEQPMPQMAPVNHNPIQNIQPNVSGRIHYFSKYSIYSFLYLFFDRLYKS